LFTLPNDLILKKAGVLAKTDQDEIVRVARKIMS